MHRYFSFTQTLVNFFCIKYNEIYVGLCFCFVSNFFTYFITQGDFYYDAAFTLSRNDCFLHSDHLDDLDQRHCHEALR